jgi:hypothetical protein
MFTTDELKRSKMCCVLSETELTRFAESEPVIREMEVELYYVGRATRYLQE